MEHLGGEGDGSRRRVMGVKGGGGDKVKEREILLPAGRSCFREFCGIYLIPFIFRFILYYLTNKR